jgi:hypothetical protein
MLHAFDKVTVLHMHLIMSQCYKNFDNVLMLHAFENVTMLSIFCRNTFADFSPYRFLMMGLLNPVTW